MRRGSAGQAQHAPSPAGTAGARALKSVRAGADLFKVFKESGGSVHLAGFDSQAEALAFVKSLKTTARVVVL